MAITDPGDLLLDAPTLVRKLYGARAGTRDEQGKAHLPAVDLQVLVALADDPDQKVEDLARRLVIEVSTVSHAIGALKAAEMIEDLPGEGHHRRRRRPLTDEGKAEVRALRRRARKLLDEHAKPQG